MKKIYLDYDEVLVNFVTPWIHWCNQTFKTKYKLKDIIDFKFLENKIGMSVRKFYNDGRPYENNTIYPFHCAKSFMEELNDKYDVYIVSNCTDDNKAKKIKHAIRYFDFDPKKFISEKYKYQVTTDGILIDDYPKTIQQHCIENKQHGIIFNFQGERVYCGNLEYTLGLPIQYVHKAKTYNDILSILRKVGY